MNPEEHLIEIHLPQTQNPANNFKEASNIKLPPSSRNQELDLDTEGRPSKNSEIPIKITHDNIYATSSPLKLSSE